MMYNMRLDRRLVPFSFIPALKVEKWKKKTKRVVVLFLTPEEQ